MKKSLLILSLALISIVSRGQSYLVEYTLENYDYLSVCGGTYCESRSISAYLKLPSGTYVWFPTTDGYGQGSFTVNSKPVQARFTSFYEFNSYGTTEDLCEEINLLDLTTYGDCFQIYNDWFGSCSSGYIDFTIKPVLTITGSAPGDYCDNTTITLNNTSGFSNPQWQYKTSTGSWQNFNPGSGNSVTFGIQTIFGASYTSFLDTPIYFRYAYSGASCNPDGNFSSELGGYVFTPAAIEAATNGSEVVKPSCINGTDGVIKIKSISRSLLSGENLTYTIYTTSNSFVGQKSSSVQPTSASPIEISGSVSSEAPFGISAGNYQVLVSSNLSLCGTPAYHTLPTITNPTQVTFTNNTPVQPLCNGESNGSITLIGTGGAGGYLYSKDGSTYQASNVLSGLSAQTYNVKIKDSKGCESGTTPIVVGQPTELTIGSASVTSDYLGSDIRCNGSTDGQITVIGADGGISPLSYSSDGGATYQSSNIFNSLGANNYTIVVKDNNNCTKQTSASIVAPAVITGTVTPTPTICNGQSSGQVTITDASGGTGTLSYAVDAGSFSLSNTITGLSAGSHAVRIQDQNLCVTTINTTITQPAAITVVATPTLVTCSGGNDGKVDIAVGNAVGTPTYSWSNAAATQNITNVPTGIYSVTVTDTKGCTGTANATVTSNPIITGPITVSTPISCNGGSNGALNLIPGGGVGPYTFSWSNGATSEDLTGVAAGFYTVTVTDSKSCQQTFNRNVTQPFPIVVNPTSSDFNGTSISCFGGNNGSISIAPTGGNGGYTYNWSNGATSQNLNSLVAGTYTVTVTDNKACTGNQSVIITQPSQLNTNLTAQNIACSGGNTGSITLNTGGGVPNYQYSIDNGASWQSSPTFVGLSVNAYNVRTRDANNCMVINTATLTSPSDLVLTLANSTNTTCNQNNGSATMSVTGGVSAYNFAWFDSGNTQIGSTNAINNLPAAVYRVVVTDQNNCTKEQSVPISSSNGPSVTVQSVTPATCSNTTDGSATISITQGQGPYTILWPNSQTTETATNLAAGNYVVEVRDQTNCLALQTVNVTAPTALTIQTITQQNPNCNGNSDGSIQILAQGGNGTYSYDWNTGSTSATLTNLIAGTYSVTTKDIKNCQTTQQFTLTNPPVFTIDLGADQKICEGQEVQKQSDVSGGTYEWTGPDNFTSTQQQVLISQPGVYTLTVTNANGCEASDNFELSFDTNLLKADFLMVTEAFAGDTVMIIDISWPVPTSVNWSLDPSATIIDQSPDYSLVKYDQPGTYNTTMTAQLAQCASSHSQSIEIIANPNEGSEGGKTKEGLIRLVQVYPNPVPEKLTVMIELSRIHQATIEIYQLNSNQRALVQSFNDASRYEADLKLNHLQSGPYVILVKSGDEIKSLKIIKL